MSCYADKINSVVGPCQIQCWIPRVDLSEITSSVINRWCYWINQWIIPSHKSHSNPDSKVHGANMGPTWVLSAPDGPHVGPMNLAIREVLQIQNVIISVMTVFWDKIWYTGVLCNIGYPFKTHLRLKFHKIFCLSITSIQGVQSFQHFAQNMAVILPCHVQNSKQLGNGQVNFGQIRFHKISVQDAFWKLILYILHPFPGFCEIKVWFIFYFGTVVLESARTYSRPC